MSSRQKFIADADANVGAWDESEAKMWSRCTTKDALSEPTSNKDWPPPPAHAAIPLPYRQSNRKQKIAGAVCIVKKPT